MCVYRLGTIGFRRPNWPQHTPKARVVATWRLSFSHTETTLDIVAVAMSYSLTELTEPTEPTELTELPSSNVLQIL